MESSNQNEHDEEDYRKGVLYVFDTGDEGIMVETVRPLENIKTRLWRILPCFVGEYKIIYIYCLISLLPTRLNLT